MAIKIALALGIVAVIGFLVVIPSYQGYLHRSRISEAIGDGLRDEVRSAIAAQVTKPGSLAGRPTEFAPTTRFVKSIAVDYRAGTVFINLDETEIGRPDAIAPGSWNSFTAGDQKGATVERRSDKKRGGGKGGAAKIRW